MSTLHDRRFTGAVLAALGVDNVAAGSALLGIEVRTFLGRSDGLPVNQNVSSDFSPAGSYTMVGNASCRLAPEAPTALTADSSKRTVRLTWADRSSDETSFLVERSLAAADGFVEIGTVAANATSYVDATVLKKTTYFYRVRAAAGSARSAYTNVAAVTVR